MSCHSVVVHTACMDPGIEEGPCEILRISNRDVEQTWARHGRRWTITFCIVSIYADQEAIRLDIMRPLLLFRSVYRPFDTLGSSNLQDMLSRLCTLLEIGGPWSEGPNANPPARTNRSYPRLFQRLAKVSPSLMLRTRISESFINCRAEGL